MLRGTMTVKPTKLHLGCGDKKIHGWTNVDLRKEVNPDMVRDITKINETYTNTVDIIYACHVLEHFHKSQTAKILNSHLYQ